MGKFAAFALRVNNLGLKCYVDALQKWFTYVNPFRYVLQALLPPQFYCETDCQEIPVVDGTSTVMESKYEYLSNWLGFEYDDRWFGVLALAIFVAVFRIGTMLGFQYVRHLKR